MGGAPLTVNGKQMWSAEAPGVRDGKWYFHELWINGHRAMRARNPNSRLLPREPVPDLDFKKPLSTGQRELPVCAGTTRELAGSRRRRGRVPRRSGSARGRRSRPSTNRRTMRSWSKHTPMRLTRRLSASADWPRLYVENATRTARTLPANGASQSQDRDPLLHAAARRADREGGGRRASARATGVIVTGRRKGRPLRSRI